MTTAHKDLPAHRAFIDKNGGYETKREGDDKEAHDAWVKSNTWDLTRDDFIRLSYFNGDLEQGSDGGGPINGSEDRPGDVVYEHPVKGAITRSMVSYWCENYGAFTHGYKVALDNNRAAIATHSADSVDAARLDFMIEREAWIAWSKDGESCRLFHRSEDGEPMPMLGWGAQHWSQDPREAIDAARSKVKP